MKIKNKLKCNVKNKTPTSADLYIYGDIVSDEGCKWSDEDMCPMDVVKALDAVKDVEQLDIYINSCGGNVFAGNAIYNRITQHKGHKTVHVDGLAASIASVIAMAGDEIIMPSNAYLMIHKAFMGVIGNSDDLREAADRLDIIEKSIIDTYVKNAGEDVMEDVIVEKMAAETWLTAKDAKALFPKVKEADSVNIAAYVTDMHFNAVPANIAIKNSEEPHEPFKESEAEEKNGVASEENGLDIEMIENFLFTEKEYENEQENA